MFLDCVAHLSINISDRAVAPCSIEFEGVCICVCGVEGGLPLCGVCVHGSLKSKHVFQRQITDLSTSRPQQCLETVQHINYQKCTMINTCKY